MWSNTWTSRTLVVTGGVLALTATLAAQPPAAGLGIAVDPAQEIACGPQAAVYAPAGVIRVISGEADGRRLIGLDDVLLINAGRSEGIEPGQEFFVRRAMRDPFLEAPDRQIPPVSIRTAGWVRIVEAGDHVSSARVLHACDAVLGGDYLEPFTRPEVPEALPPGEPDWADPARILMANERRQVGAGGSLMVLDRGADRDVQPGQRVTVFRPTVPGGPLRRIAEATVLSVSPWTSLIRLETSRDAVHIGDRVALHK